MLKKQQQRLSKDRIHTASQPNSESKLQKLSIIQKAMFQKILDSQKLNLKNIQIQKIKNQKINKQKPLNAKATFENIIKHPANGQHHKGGNGCWMYLANFIQQTHDLDSVQKRFSERKKIRQSIQQKNEQLRKREQEKINKQKQYAQFENFYQNKGRKTKNSTKNSKSQSQKIPFLLQRQLRRRQVQQNKRRIQKSEEYKIKRYFEDKKVEI